MESLTDKLARYFKERPNQAISAPELAAQFGYGGWRSRVVDARREYGMDIRNEQIRRHGRTYSYYRFIPSTSPTPSPGVERRSDPYNQNAEFQLR